MKITIFWDTRLCNLLKEYQSFGGTYRFNPQLALTMKVICSSETSVGFQQTTWRYVPEDSTLHNHRYKNLKSRQEIVLFVEKYNKFNKSK
jgi:hypothetical protein